MLSSGPCALLHFVRVGLHEFTTTFRQFCGRPNTKVSEGPIENVFRTPSSYVDLFIISQAVLHLVCPGGRGVCEPAAAVLGRQDLRGRPRTERVSSV